MSPEDKFWKTFLETQEEVRQLTKGLTTSDEVIALGDKLTAENEARMREAELDQMRALAEMDAIIEFLKDKHPELHRQFVETREQTLAELAKMQAEHERLMAKTDQIVSGPDNPQ